MASAILSSRNERNSTDFMSKFTVNSNVTFTRLQNITYPNLHPNPNPNSSRFFSRDVHWRNQEQLRSSVHSEAAFVDSPINSVPANSYNYRYITYRIGSYTRLELKELRKKLVYDLQRVRELRHWICSTPISKKHYQPPPLALPAPPTVDLTVKEKPKSVVGQKRTKPASLVREAKKLCGARVKNNQKSKLVMRKCGQILGKLMKHKHGWVFNTPVDAAAMKLSDYHKIISNPMDLGTIKSKLTKNEYESTVAFASDVRLTFQNAMVYNGKGSEVFAMAERLLLLFEDMFNQIYQSKKQNRSTKVHMENPIPNPSVRIEKPVSNARKSNPVTPQVEVNPGNTSIDNFRMPKKPEMTAQEKSELAAGLLNLQLGPEGMDQIMAIIKKGVFGLEQEGDEIELDLGVLDDETLWELHKFIGVSRKKTITNLESSVQTDISSDREEEIDIGEEIPVTNFPFLEIEKDGVNVSSTGSSSSSSSGSDSSSSDSDGCSGEAN